MVRAACEFNVVQLACKIVNPQVLCAKMLLKSIVGTSNTLRKHTSCARLQSVGVTPW